MTEIRADRPLPPVQDEPDIPAFMKKKMEHDRRYRKAKFWLTAAFIALLVTIDILIIAQLVADIAG